MSAAMFQRALTGDASAQQVDENIQVLVRARKTENAKNTVPSDEQSLSFANKNYLFDRVLGSECTQSDVFAPLATVVDGVVKGYNATIIAYGQTGSVFSF
jgi:hypothetical protein